MMKKQCCAMTTVALLISMCGLVTVARSYDILLMMPPILAAQQQESTACDDYVKLDSNGDPLDDQTVNYTDTPWQCVKDNATGLIWEVKTDDDGLQDKNDTFTWYNTDPDTNVGTNGVENPSGNTCFGWTKEQSTTYCNTEAYVNRVNAAGWCGATDWRMPTLDELKGIVNYDHSNPAIDTGCFPNAVSSGVWSGSPYADFPSYAWSVNFSNGASSTSPHLSSLAVRLVRGGQ